MIAWLSLSSASRIEADRMLVNDGWPAGNNTGCRTRSRHSCRTLIASGLANFVSVVQRAWSCAVSNVNALVPRGSRGQRAKPPVDQMRQAQVELNWKSDSTLQPAAPTPGFWLCLVVVTALAAGLRIHNLDRASFWVDELNTVRDCANLSEIHKSKVLGYVPTALGLWAYGVKPSEIPIDAPEKWRAMGINEWTCRLPSALIGIVTIPLLGLACCRLFGPRVAGILMLLLAVAPWHIFWSQASRFYTQQFLFYNLCLIWYFVATRDASRARMAWSFVVLLLAFLSQPPALVIAAVFGLDWLWGLARRQPVRWGAFGWVGAIATLAICAGVLSLDVSRNPSQWSQFSGDHYNTVKTLILGTVFMVGPAVVMFGLLSVWGRLRRGDRLVTFLLLAAVMPTVAYAIISMRSYVGLRYVFVCVFGWLALAAIGIDHTYTILRQRAGWVTAVVPAALLLVAMAWTNYGYYTSGVGYHTRWRDAFAYVAAHRQPGDLVVCPNPMIGRYYLQDAAVQTMPRSSDGLVAVQKPMWLVDETDDVIHGSVHSWMYDATDLKAYFDVRVVQPHSSVKVFRFDPARRKS